MFRVIILLKAMSITKAEYKISVYLVAFINPVSITIINPVSITILVATSLEIPPHR